MTNTAHETKIATFVASVRPTPGTDLDAVAQAVSDALRNAGCEVVLEFGWTPDPDTIADCAWVDYGQVRVIDINEIATEAAAR